jgi:hypothetical protein
MSLTPGGREAVADTIRLVKVDLVGCLSDKSAMGLLGVVLFDVETEGCHSCEHESIKCSRT